MAWNLEKYYKTLLYPRTPIDHKITNYVIARLKAIYMAKILVNVNTGVISNEIKNLLKIIDKIRRKIEEMPEKPNGKEDYEELAKKLIELESLVEELRALKQLHSLKLSEEKEGERE